MATYSHQASDITVANPGFLRGAPTQEGVRQPIIWQKMQQNKKFNTTAFPSPTST